MLDPLVWREQAEGQQDASSFDAELIFVIIRIDKRDVRNPVRNQIDLGGRRLINFLQHPPTSLRHHHQPRRERDQIVRHAPLFRVRLTQDGVQRRHHRHFQLAQQRQHMTPRRPSENPKLVLQTDDVCVADVQKIRSSLIRRQILFLDFKSHHLRIFVSPFDVVHRHSEAFVSGKFRRHGRQDIRRERRDAAFARQVVAEKCYLPKFRGGGQKFARFNLAWRDVIPPRDFVTIGPFPQCST